MSLPRPLATVLSRLPEAPPTLLLVTALNLLRRRLWPEDDFAWLTGRRVRMEISDLGRGVTFSFDGRHFVLASQPADVVFSASLADYWIIARRQEDPDTLFFQRRLTIAGDTELGLQLKNLMDATDFEPLLQHLPQGLRSRLVI
ncbi:ubiquinone anaerobic biosynthesis accessory factor UbiT [Chitinilyticum piscinae]|uniref:Ubiquinone biosynthesis accessory factor UbiT n=1 Tax=Chitinilyticum piscinae TaxID=2866724 RepID=A0A8J7FPT8_9NEIS|nr:SCP2 sterol-binding domain-containing protein [Chitinilyticum piscinae]MBE9608391.1 SCP2 sterol-binding domain-containing protein [Chitinilyticum piscinae]